MIVEVAVTSTFRNARRNCACELHVGIARGNCAWELHVAIARGNCASELRVGMIANSGNFAQQSPRARQLSYVSPTGYVRPWPSSGGGHHRALARDRSFELLSRSLLRTTEVCFEALDFRHDPRLQGFGAFELPTCAIERRGSCLAACHQALVFLAGQDACFVGVAPFGFQRNHLRIEIKIQTAHGIYLRCSSWRPMFAHQHDDSQTALRQILKETRMPGRGPMRQE